MNEKEKKYTRISIWQEYEGATINKGKTSKVDKEKKVSILKCHLY